MDSICSTPSSSRASDRLLHPLGTSRLPQHLTQPSSSNAGETSDPSVFTSASSIKQGQTYVSVHTLTKETFFIAVSQKTKVHDVLWKVGEQLEITDDKLFGLALRQPTEGIGGDQPRHEYFFLDPAQKITKYAPKQPRFGSWHNKSTEHWPLLVLYFRVRVYINQVGQLTCPKALEHYYLQLKDNLLDQWSGRNSVSEERCWEMASLALKVDHECDCSGDFRPEQYFPLWVINERGLEYVRKNMPAACEDLKDMKRHQAMVKFATEASRQPFALNCHLYGLRRHKMDTADNAVLAINARGIEMCDIGVAGERIPLRSLSWSRVIRLSFDRKKLTIIGSDSTKMSLYAQSDSKTRYLLELCRAVHQTLLVMQHLYAGKAPIPQPYTEKSVDRLSTSSNTTSGIASGDAEKDCDSLSSTCDHRGQGSTSSKQRDRIRLDSNLELKFERMQQLDSIRQERAASQSSEVSDNSADRMLDRRADIFMDLPHPNVHSEHRMPNGFIDNRPSSVDSTSSHPSDVMTRSVPVDVNYNTKYAQRTEILPSGPTVYAAGGQLLHQTDSLLYRSSSGSRSNSIQHSNEVIPELLATGNGFHHLTMTDGQLNSEDTESTLRSTATVATTTAPATSSVGTNTIALQSSSLHDLRTASLYQPQTHYLDTSAAASAAKMAALQSQAIDQARAQTQARSYSPPTQQQQQWMQLNMQQMPIRNGTFDQRFDSELWINPLMSGLLDCAPGPSNIQQQQQSGVRLFTKKTPQPTRIAHPISRVQSMPSHYHNHLSNAYNVRNTVYKEHPMPSSSLHHAQSLYNPSTRPRNPPPYEHPHRLDLDAVQYTPAGLPAEAAGGQPAFPPASATPSHFSQDNIFRDKEEMTEANLMNKPLLRRLLFENSGSLVSSGPVPSSLSSGHQRRPSSSCIDLTTTATNEICQPNGHVSVYSSGGQRNDYFPDSAHFGFVPSNNILQKENTNSYLPPPPPYAQRSLVH